MKVEFCISMCSAIVRLHISDGLLLGLRVRKKGGQECALVRKKRFVEKQKSPVHKEVINICMTEQMTAYFHGNTLVSSEMSGGDSKQACANKYMAVY